MSLAKATVETATKMLAGVGCLYIAQLCGIIGVITPAAY